MEENENIFDKISEIFGGIPGSLNILEEEIDIDIQMNYFDSSRKNKKNKLPVNLIEDSSRLFSEKTTLEEKKDILVQLASLDKVEAFRTIEKFQQTEDEMLKDWTILALKESRMLLESKILNENQVFISTGLGGKGDKLRYFVIILGKNLIEFSDIQKKIIKNEFSFALSNHNSELEALEFSESMATIQAIVPLSSPVKAVFEEAVYECNNYGDFLNSDFIITNVKKLSFDEIKIFIQQQKENKGLDFDI
ncbi:MAG: hypothetical protein K9H12_11060 [Bacteroidales bacterium]|nr:hypothetical protein [Bacteroidales bacterium]